MKKTQVTPKISVLTLGFILGFSIALLMIGHRVDYLINRNSMSERELKIAKEKIIQLEQELEEKDKDWQEKTQVKIKSIIIFVEGITATSVELQIEEEIYELLKDLIGRPIEEIDPLIVEKSLERLIGINDRLYQVRPIRSIYNKETIFWIEASIKE